MAHARMFTNVHVYAHVHVRALVHKSTRLRACISLGFRKHSRPCTRSGACRQIYSFACMYTLRLSYTLALLYTLARIYTNVFVHVKAFGAATDRNSRNGRSYVGAPLMALFQKSYLAPLPFVLFRYVCGSTFDYMSLGLFVYLSLSLALLFTIICLFVFSFLSF